MWCQSAVLSQLSKLLCRSALPPSFLGIASFEIICSKAPVQSWEKSSLLLTHKTVQEKRENLTGPKSAVAVMRTLLLLSAALGRGVLKQTRKSQCKLRRLKTSQPSRSVCGVGVRLFCFHKVERFIAVTLRSLCSDTKPGLPTEKAWSFASLTTTSFLRSSFIQKLRWYARMTRSSNTSGLCRKLSTFSWQHTLFVCPAYGKPSTCLLRKHKPDPIFCRQSLCQQD